jgi:hypothetical protein
VSLLKLLTFSVWPIKCQVSAVAIALFNLNAQCKTMFSLLEKKDVHLTGQHGSIRPLKVKYTSSENRLSHHYHCPVRNSSHGCLSLEEEATTQSQNTWQQTPSDRAQYPRKIKFPNLHIYESTMVFQTHMNNTKVLLSITIK